MGFLCCGPQSQEWGLSSRLFCNSTSFWVILKFSSNAFVSTFLKRIPKCVLCAALITGSHQLRLAGVGEQAAASLPPPVQVSQKIKTGGLGTESCFYMIWVGSISARPVSPGWATGHFRQDVDTVWGAFKFLCMSNAFPLCPEHQINSSVRFFS